MKIGIIKETKIPQDKRVAITPEVAKKITLKNQEVLLIVEPSEIRSFSDKEYIAKGIVVRDAMMDCDILLGIKEVDINALIQGKTYMFFSHTGKKQAYNKKLLQKCSGLGITLIDYEYLTDENGNRLIAFGKWAGIVGAYNTLLTYGKRSRRFNLKRAYECFDHVELFEQLKNVNLPPIKILVTGGGRVARGALEVLKKASIKEVPPEDYLKNNFNEAVFTRLDPVHYVKPIDESKEFSFEHFINHPDEYSSTFMQYAIKTDVYIACHYWDPRSPEFLKPEDYLHSEFGIKVIGDVSCDIKKPIASTIRPSKIESPYYGYNPRTREEDEPFKEGNVSVMAVDNLPAELPRSSSEDFANMFYEKIFPELLKSESEIIERATILKNGKLTKNFEYLRDYLEEK